ncbi:MULTISPECIES: antitoxin [Corynebacterium]|uniref:antitoxin n=1 Tax=Corynebacterium TaxID=1716 RepID=UPI00254C395A|nr:MULTISPECIES: antitoxin [Corynebacterium]MDK6258864.1 antitoxin [Corynebacterium frankenforstense]MDK8895014.1 antitoxin [Corynebacterium sp. MSK006]
MGIFDKAKGKAEEFLNSDEGKQKANDALDTAADKAKDRFGEDNADKIDTVRDKIGERLGGDQPEGEK